jgi:hypothetical protein
VLVKALEAIGFQGLANETRTLSEGEHSCIRSH